MSDIKLTRITWNFIDSLRLTQQARSLQSELSHFLLKRHSPWFSRIRQLVCLLLHNRLMRKSNFSVICILLLFNGIFRGKFSVQFSVNITPGRKESRFFTKADGKKIHIARLLYWKSKTRREKKKKIFFSLHMRLAHFTIS